MSDNPLEPKEVNPYRHVANKPAIVIVQGVEIRSYDLGHGDTYIEVDGLSPEICEQFETLADAIMAVEGFHEPV